MIEDILQDFEHSWNRTDVCGIARGDKLGKGLLGMLERTVVGRVSEMRVIQIDAIRCTFI